MPPMLPDGAVVITAAQQYAELREVRSAVDRLTNTIDPAFSDLRRDLADQVTKQLALEVVQAKDGNRITILETKLNAAWAFLGLLAVALGVVAAFLGK